jgi:4-hydroxybenzoyl-CoA reductase subunit beta
MLPLPSFHLVRPRGLEEAVAVLAEAPDESMVLAGGTDLLPNLKHGLHAPRRLVSLRGVAELRRVARTREGGTFFGAGLTLAEVAAHPVARSHYPALARAAGLVAGPQLRHMGTLGGNLCLDTRCMYYNRTSFWRQALGHCLKKDGDRCHVVPWGSRCVAAFSADTPGPLIAYAATVCLRSARRERRIPVESFFRGDGGRNTVREPDEIVTGVELPPPVSGGRFTYHKLRRRGAIDFPMLSVSVGATLGGDARVTTLEVVVGGLGSRPRRVARAGEVARGRPLDPALALDVAGHAADHAHPLETIPGDPVWRRNALRVLVRRALMELAGK